MDNLQETQELSPRDKARVEIASRLLGAVMTGNMARNQPLEDALRNAEKSRDRCLISAGNLYDANESDFKDGYNAARLSAATELFSSAVSALVAGGNSIEIALSTAGRSRDHILRTANGMVLDAAATPAKPGEPAPLRSVLAAYRGDRQDSRGPRNSGGNNPIL